MLKRLGFNFESATTALIIGSLLLTITQIFTTTWCSASGSYYGFYFDGQTLRSCVYELPARSFFSLSASLAAGLGLFSMVIEWAAAAFRWREFRELNVSRILFVASFLLTDYLLQNLANALPHSNSENAGWAFNNFYWLFPTALIIFVISSTTIYKKREFILYLNRKV